MPQPFNPKLFNPRHPERTLLYQTVAEHDKTWLELASAGQSGGQGDHHSPNPMCAKPLPITSNAAPLPTALPVPAVATAATTTLSPSPAKAVESAPRATRGAWWRRRRTSPTTSSPACRCTTGCCLSPSGCGTTCSAMGPHSTWCCKSPAGDCANAARQQPWCAEPKQGSFAHRRSRRPSQPARMQLRAHLGQATL